jgi:hypothetical protein
MSQSLAEALPAEINRVRELQDQFKSLRGMALVEPQIAMMEADIQAGIKAAAEGDLTAMILSCTALQGWTG